MSRSSTASLGPGHDGLVGGPHIDQAIDADHKGIILLGGFNLVLQEPDGLIRAIQIFKDIGEQQIVVAVQRIFRQRPAVNGERLLGKAR